MDLHTIAAMERLSRRTRDVLRSQAADPTWRSIKSSLGLNVCFDRWPERAFLAFALRQRCSVRKGHSKQAMILLTSPLKVLPSRGSEHSINIARFVRRLLRVKVCHYGYVLVASLTPCAQHSVIVMGNGSEDLSKSIVKSMSSIQSGGSKVLQDSSSVGDIFFLPHDSGPFVRSGWVDTPNKNTKLYQRTYVDALTHWMQNLPAAVKTCVPNGLIAKHIENYTDSFVKVSNSFPRPLFFHNIL